MQKEVLPIKNLWLSLLKNNLINILFKRNQQKKWIILNSQILIIYTPNQNKINNILIKMKEEIQQKGYHKEVFNKTSKKCQV